MPARPPAVPLIRLPLELSLKYEVIAFIGKGSFGSVFSVRQRTTDKLFALKSVAMDKCAEEDRELIVQEVTLLTRLRHSNIINLIDSLIDEKGLMVYIVLELCSKDLEQLLKEHAANHTQMTFPEVFYIVVQLIRALDYMHRPECRGEPGGPRYMYRDIKSGNDGSAVRLGDFGLARMLEANEYARTYAGTPSHISPEMARGEPYGPATDIFSLGVLVAEMVNGSPAFPNRMIRARFHPISQYRPPRLRYGTPSTLQDLVNACCALDPAARPTAHSLKSVWELIVAGKEVDADVRTAKIDAEHLAERLAMDGKLAELAASQAEVEAMKMDLTEKLAALNVNDRAIAPLPYRRTVAAAGLDVTPVEVKRPRIEEPAGLRGLVRRTAEFVLRNV